MGPLLYRIRIFCHFLEPSLRWIRSSLLLHFLAISIVNKQSNIDNIIPLKKNKNGSNWIQIGWIVNCYVVVPPPDPEPPSQQFFASLLAINGLKNFLVFRKKSSEIFPSCGIFLVSVIDSFTSMSLPTLFVKIACTFFSNYFEIYNKLMVVREIPGTKLATRFALAEWRIKQASRPILVRGLQQDLREYLFQ